MGAVVYLFNFPVIAALQILVLQVGTGIVLYIVLAKIFKIEGFNYLVATMKQLLSTRKGASA
jgi:hypothetical protein